MLNDYIVSKNKQIVTHKVKQKENGILSLNSR
jgi:hypothetical protein